MKLTTGSLLTLCILMTTAATPACVGMYDSGVGPSNPPVTHVPGSPGTPGYSAPYTTPYVPVADTCGVASGYALPFHTVDLYDDDGCGTNVLASTTADQSGYWAVSVCASVPEVSAVTIDAYGQSSVCSAPIPIVAQ